MSEGHSNFWMDDEPRQVWTIQDVYDDLTNLEGIAKALGVTRTRVSMWISRRERIRSPEPVCTIGGTNIYSIEEWKSWYAAWSGDLRRQKWVTHARSYRRDVWNQPPKEQDEDKEHTPQPFFRVDRHGNPIELED